MSSSLRHHVLITGGSRGIGASIAHAFANQPNHTVTILGRDRDALTRTASKLGQASSSSPSSRHGILVGDVGQHETWESLRFRGAAESAGKGVESDEGGVFGSAVLVPSVLVNAAGISSARLLVQTPASDIDRLVQTNLLGTIYACRWVGKAMMKHRRSFEAQGISPCIINISSLLGVQGGKGAAVYAATKAGVLGLTRALAAEMGQFGVRVNAIVPGYVDTDMTRDLSEAFKDSLKDRIPSKRLGDPSSIAEAALFLAKNQYANNCVLNLDGGLSAMVSGSSV